MHKREITHIVKTVSIDCKDKMLFLLSFERNLFNKITKKCLGKHNAKARFETLKIKIL